MTGDMTSLRIPPEIRRRLEGIEAELRPTPARSPVRALGADGRPTLYLVDGRVASRVRRMPVRRAPRANVGWLAVAGVATLFASVGLASLVATNGGSGPGASVGSTVSSPGSAATATATAAAVPASSSPSLLGAPSGPIPRLVDIQLIRVAADPAMVATRFLRSKCVTKEPGLESAVVKKLLTTALVAKVDAGWVDQTRTMFVARDVIDAAGAFGATALIEGPDETWAIARDGTTTVALRLEDMPTIKDRQAWWSSLVLRPTACP